MRYFCLCLWVAVLPALGENLPKLIKKIQPAVATVRSFDDSGKLLVQASGFFIDKAGLLITSYHVVHNAAQIEVKTFQGAIYLNGRVRAKDGSADLALVDTAATPSKVLEIRKQTPDVGERVLVIGTPLGFERSVSDGIVSAVRHVPDYGTVVQMTAPISAGSSGSPVVNLKGEVIGVVRSQRREGQNLNFAVPGGRVLELESAATRRVEGLSAAR